MQAKSPVVRGRDRSGGITADLVGLIAELTGFGGRIVWDRGKPDGQPRRSADVTRARELLGFEARWDWRDGLAATIAWWRRQAGVWITGLAMKGSQGPGRDDWTPRRGRW